MNRLHLTLKLALSAMVLGFVPSCGSVLASLGGSTAGGRGTLEILFDNQTPYRAIFTVGVYDPQDRTSQPTFVQFAVDTNENQTDFNRGLAPGVVTARASLLVNCGRVVSLGGQDMLDRINKANDTPSDGSPIIDAALREGIYFTDKPIDDADPNGVDSYVLHSDPVQSVLGVDYQCDAMLIYHFIADPNQADGVLVTLDVIAVDEDSGT